MSATQPMYQAIFSACRTEHDSMGEVEVLKERYWGAHAKRSIKNFQIGTKAKMPEKIIGSFGFLKKVATSGKS